MALYNFHRVLIAAAILFSFGYGLYSIRQDGSVNLAMGVVSLGICLGMVGYLIYFNYRLRVPTQAASRQHA